MALIQDIRAVFWRLNVESSPSPLGAFFITIGIAITMLENRKKIV